MDKVREIIAQERSSCETEFAKMSAELQDLFQNLWVIKRMPPHFSNTSNKASIDRLDRAGPDAVSMKATIIWQFSAQAIRKPHHGHTGSCNAPTV